MLEEAREKARRKEELRKINERKAAALLEEKKVPLLPGGERSHPIEEDSLPSIAQSEPIPDQRPLDDAELDDLINSECANQGMVEPSWNIDGKNGNMRETEYVPTCAETNL